MIKTNGEAAKTGVKWWLGQIVSWTLLFTTIALLLAMVAVPRFTGSTPYTVLTGSMRPAMPPGTLVVTKPVDGSELGIGDAITYQLRSGQPEVVTHRITSVSQSLGGELRFITQGDANPVPDANPVQPGQIRGVVWYSIPLVGYVNTWLTGDQRMWSVGIAAALLLGYTACMFTSAALEHWRKKRRAAATDETSVEKG